MHSSRRSTKAFITDRDKCDPPVKRPAFVSLPRCAGCILVVAPAAMTQIICEECVKDIPDGKEHADAYKKTVRSYADILKEKGAQGAN